jgi:hypothetical protein
MKLKSILLTVVATISFATETMAQVPNYVPTNGLVGWWPFNGNANDESGNGNNGTVNGATLTSDRFANLNSAYNFNGQNNNIVVPNSISINPSLITVSVWVNPTSFSPNAQAQYIIDKSFDPVIRSWAIRISGSGELDLEIRVNNIYYTFATTSVLNLNQWNNLVFVYDGDSAKLYRNNLIVISQSLPGTLTNFNYDLSIGYFPHANIPPYGYFWNGKLDDIGIWNRPLTQQEITDLFNVVNCANNTAITPQTNSLATGNTATFTASTTDPNPNYVWQSDFGQGFQTLNNFGNYSGVNSATLNLTNVQLSNHNQPFRVVSTSGNCIDTSNVALINILDTCLVTVYDTLLNTVTDTLVINAQITGINPPNNLNTLKVFPNPASTHITIDYGNFNAMSGYTLTIVNSIGQTVFTTPINQQTSYIDLSTWTGSGIYYVQLIDTQNNTIENRKIVIQ